MESVFDCHPSGPRVNYLRWLWRVITWDGVLPLGMWLAPMGVCWLVEDDGRDTQAGCLALTAIFLSFIALGVRAWFGTKHISSNHCEMNFRTIQFLCFLAGIGFLWLTDMIAISCYDLWKDAAADVSELLMALAVWYAIYLPLMIVAMYPGREPLADCNPYHFPIMNANDKTIF